VPPVKKYCTGSPERKHAVAAFYTEITLQRIAADWATFSGVKGRGQASTANYFIIFFNQVLPA
jgi:hypothetical protein